MSLTEKKPKAKKAPKGEPKPLTNIPQAPAFASVNLVPREYYTDQAERKILRLISLLVIGVLVLGVAGSFGAGYLARAAEQEFVKEQERGAALRAERAQYSELTGVLSELETAKAAQTVALYAEVDWTRVVREFEKALPGEGSRMTELNLAQRLAPGVGNGGFNDTSDANPLSQLTPVFLEYRFTSDDKQAGSQLLDRLVNEMTGYQWANQTTAQYTSGDEYEFAGVIRLGMPAIGTDRATAIDESTLEALRAAFAEASANRDAAARGAN